ncbi:IclR family transcriptional regulator [Rhizobium sp. SYY.PMSO]|uniref:IclR family transcriptional regulator n=1 Tax=Rhizobium sp. SYY.PMSO TaxID=3382192 RepID=UPI0013B02A9F
MQTDNASEAGSVKSATRVMDLLDLVSQSGPMTHTELASSLKIPKSSLTPLLQTLLGRNFLHYSAESKRYGIGVAVNELSNRSQYSVDLLSHAPPILKKITDRTGESSSLSFLIGDRHQAAAVALSSKSIIANLKVGEGATLYAGSPGKAMLAFLPERMRESYYQRVKFVKHSVNTIETLEALKRNIEEIRQEGAAYVFDEYTPGMGGAAVPILNAAGFPLACLNVGVPVFRFDHETQVRCVAVLREAVHDIRVKAGII